jgi:2-hydroxy-6-oxonona-2,4-dienedioate hydrolase
MNKSSGVKKSGEFRYVESEGSGIPIVLLHGLMGALSNFSGIFEYFALKRKVVLPFLPIYDIPFRKVSVDALVDYLDRFLEYKGYSRVYLLGNSLGGHIAQLYTIRKPNNVHGLILTGSSGLFESAMGNTFPKRGNYEFIRKKAESVFYDPAVATKELVDDVYNTVNDLRKAMSVVAVAKSAVRHNLEHELHKIKVPTLIIWGKYDNVTPLWVGEKFHELIKGSRLLIIDECGHAPMMERPEIFNKELDLFIEDVEDDNFFSEDIIGGGVVKTILPDKS